MPLFRKTPPNPILESSKSAEAKLHVAMVMLGDRKFRKSGFDQFKFGRVAISSSSGFVPQFMHASPLTDIDYPSDRVDLIEISHRRFGPYGVTVTEGYHDGKEMSPDAQHTFHVAFVPERESILTQIGRPVEPLQVIRNPEVQLDYLSTVNVLLQKIIDYPGYKFYG